MNVGLRSTAKNEFPGLFEFYLNNFKVGCEIFRLGYFYISSFSYWKCGFGVIIIVT